ncbi:thiamine transporter 1-like [Ischnura elegans]|uniref:thiamine transporter 1-like n=1 Tax=Ischnura elegans TaxID=197161 RepID=UPI001ED86799|nr:thiamine transporter 1-like [Ischnura elegans]
MELWLKVSLLLCMFGFCKELRPSEPFVTPYLVGPWRNFTTAEVNQLIYPVGTYSYLGLLVLVFLVTDILRYKAVILLDAICGIVTWSLLAWAPGLFAAQLLEFFYGAFMAGEVAYYSYAYARIEDRDLYARLTSHTRAAYLFGRCASGILGQALYSTNAVDLWEMNLISLAALCLAFAIALFLPPVQHSIYFHRREGDLTVVKGHDGNDNSLPNAGEYPSQDLAKDGNLEIENNGFTNISEEDRIESEIEVETRDGVDADGSPKLGMDKRNGVVGIGPLPDSPTKDSAGQEKQPAPNSNERQGIVSFFSNAFRLLWRHAYISYSNKQVVRWSAWWIISTAGFLQVLNYIQVLWEVVIEEQGAENVSLLNGGVEAVQTVLGALATLACGLLRLNWEFVGEFTLAAVSGIEGLVMILSAIAKTLWLEYICYIIFGIFYHSMVTVASMEVAKRLEDDCYGLIFGINTFLALVVQSIWTVVVISKSGFGLGPRDQFMVCGGYFLVIGLVFFIVASISTYKMGVSVFLKQKLWLPKVSATSTPPE